MSDERTKVSVWRERREVFLFFTLLPGVDPHTWYLLPVATFQKNRFVNVFFFFAFFFRTLEKWSTKKAPFSCSFSSLVFAKENSWKSFFPGRKLAKRGEDESGKFFRSELRLVTFPLFLTLTFLNFEHWRFIAVIGNVYVLFRDWGRVCWVMKRRKSAVMEISPPRPR